MFFEFPYMYQTAFLLKWLHFGAIEHEINDQIDRLVAAGYLIITNHDPYKNLPNRLDIGYMYLLTEAGRDFINIGKNANY